MNGQLLPVMDEAIIDTAMDAAIIAMVACIGHDWEIRINKSLSVKERERVCKECVSNANKLLRSKTSAILILDYDMCWHMFSWLQ